MTRTLKDVERRNLLINQMKSEFITIAAHQLRTPLSGIKWTFKMLLAGDMGKINKDQEDFLKKAYTKNENMIALVNDLLNVSRLEEGRFGFKFEKRNLVEFVSDVIKDNQSLFNIKKIKLEFIKSKQDVIFASIDPDKLKIALQNLLDNARDYTLKNGQVSVELINKTNSIEIKIKDTGIGIPAQDLTNVFNKFFRSSNASKLGHEGTGLGLFIAKNIVQEHNGRIWLKSEINKGTTISLVLPLQKIKLLNKKHEKNINNRR